MVFGSGLGLGMVIDEQALKKLHPTGLYKLEGLYALLGLLARLLQMDFGGVEGRRRYIGQLRALDKILRTRLSARMAANRNLRIKAWVLQSAHRMAEVRTLIGERALARWFKYYQAKCLVQKYPGVWRHAPRRPLIWQHQPRTWPAPEATPETIPEVAHNPNLPAPEPLADTSNVRFGLTNVRRAYALVYGLADYTMPEVKLATEPTQPDGAQSAHTKQTYISPPIRFSPFELGVSKPHNIDPIDDAQTPPRSLPKHPNPPPPKVRAERGLAAAHGESSPKPDKSNKPPPSYWLMRPR